MDTDSQTHTDQSEPDRDRYTDTVGHTRRALTQRHGCKQSDRASRHKHTWVRALDHASIHIHEQAWVQAVRQSKQTQTHMGTCIRPCKHTHTRTGMDTSSQDRPSRHRHTKIHALDHASIHIHEQAWIHAVRQTGQTQTHKDTRIRPFKHTQTRTGMDTCSQTGRADTDTQRYMH